MFAPEEVGHEKEEEETIHFDSYSASPSALAESAAANSAAAASIDGMLGQVHSVATVSSPWEYDDFQVACASCASDFHALLNRRHHCRLCGKIFCHACSSQKALIPPTRIVLAPVEGKKAKPRAIQPPEERISFTPDPDPDRMLTYVQDQQVLYGKGLEERFTLAREPLRVCKACFTTLQPLQDDLRSTNSNAMRYNSIDPTDPKRLFNSPLAFTLGHEIRKAAYTLSNLLPQPRRGSRLGAVVSPHNANFDASSEWQQCKDTCQGLSPNLGDLDGVHIPARLLEQARGVAVMTVVKGGFGLAGAELGTGLVVARTNNNRASSDNNNNTNSNNSGTWSAPCAIGTAGMAWGALLGAQVSDHVFLLMTDEAVNLLFQKGSVQLGADAGVAVGPIGRALEGSLGATPNHPVAPIYTYSQSKGLYAGISLDGKMIGTRDDVNERFYGRRVTGMELLHGAVPTPPAAQPLYEALTRCHVYASQSSGRGGSRATASRMPPLAPPPSVFREYGETVERDEPHYYQHVAATPPPPPVVPPSQPPQQPPLQPPPQTYVPTIAHIPDAHSVTTRMSDVTTDPGY